MVSPAIANGCPPILVKGRNPEDSCLGTQLVMPIPVEQPSAAGALTNNGESWFIPLLLITVDVPATDTDGA